MNGSSIKRLKFPLRCVSTWPGTRAARFCVNLAHFFQPDTVISFSGISPAAITASPTRRNSVAPGCARPLTNGIIWVDAPQLRPSRHWCVPVLPDKPAQESGSASAVIFTLVAPALRRCDPDQYATHVKPEAGGAFWVHEQSHRRAAVPTLFGALTPSSFPATSHGGRGLAGKRRRRRTSSPCLPPSVSLFGNRSRQRSSLKILAACDDFVLPDAALLAPPSTPPVKFLGKTGEFLSTPC